MGAHPQEIQGKSKQKTRTTKNITIKTLVIHKQNKIL